MVVVAINRPAPNCAAVTHTLRGEEDITQPLFGSEPETKAFIISTAQQLQCGFDLIELCSVTAQLT